MATTRRPNTATAGEQPKDWEDEYHRLKQKYDDLKFEFNEKDQHNKMLQAKIRKLEGDYSQMTREMGGVVPKSNKPEDREDRNMIGVLNEQIVKLKAILKKEKEKCSKFEDDNAKLKRQVEMYKSTAYLKKTGVATLKDKTAPVSEVDIVPTPTAGFSQKRPHTPVAVTHSVIETHDFSHPDFLEVSRKMKARLSEAEREIVRLAEENEKLRTVAKGKASIIDLENQLRDTNWKLQQLQVQYDYAISKGSHHGDNKMSELDEYAQKVRDLRRALEDLRLEKELSDAKAARSTQLEDTVVELRQANRGLEDKIARLCEAPFISDAFGQHDARLRYEEALKERDEYRMKADHMQEALATLHAALTTLKQQNVQSREDKEAAEKLTEQLKIKLGELQNGSNLMQDQLRLYSGDDGIDPEALERALTLVKRRGEAKNKLHFLEDPEGGDVSFPRQLEEYKMMNLRLTEENEKLENMLKMQHKINKDLHKELDTLIRGRDKENKDMVRKANDSEEIALKRLDEIHALKAQIRQYVYGLAKNKKGVVPNNMPINDLALADVNNDEDEDNALLAELLEDKGEDLRPDENMMEIWVKSAVIKDNGILSPGSSTFVVIDFFDYESQTTSLLSGVKPNWDFAATYRLSVDDFLLRYLAVDVVTLELNMAAQGDFTMLARCTLPVSALLKSKPRLKLVNYPMLSVKTGQIIAHITLDIRLALPVSELYKLFLERHPAERAQIEEMSAKRMLEAASMNELSKNLAPTSLYSGEDESRLFNEFEIIIHKATGLPKSGDNKPPKAYTHFQLLGHPDKFTNPVLDTCDPVFNEKFTFPMITNDQQLRLLGRSKLQFAIIDMKGEELDMKNEGLIGEVSVNLSVLTEGRAISDVFVIKDVHGNKTGELHITIKWKHDLKKHREIGPNGLSGLDVELLIATFAPADFNEGIVDYEHFVRFVSPTREATIAMNKIRQFCIETCDREGTTARQIFDVYFPVNGHVDEHSFVETMLKTHVDVLPDDLVQLFHFMCGDDDKFVSLDRCLAILSLDEVTGIPWSLVSKVRARAQDLKERGISVTQLFQDADQWGGKGMVTRMEFKNVLKHMGFRLIDEIDPIQSAGENFRPTRTKESNKPEDRDEALEDNDIMNDTMDNQDDVLMATKTDYKAASAKGSAGVNAHMNQQRQIFENKKNDLQKKSAQVLEMEMAAQAERVNQERATTDIAPHSKVEHRSGAISTKTDKNRIPDSDITRQSATKMQAVYRGHHTRQSLRASRSPERSGPSKPTPVPALADVNLSDSLTYEASSGKYTIIDVEDVLLSSFKTSTTQLKESLVNDFGKLDRKRTGYVARKQFAYVLQQHPTITLHGPLLRYCMDFFDASSDGTKIDYNAFLRFCHQQEPELLPSIQKLNQMVLPRDSVKKFAKFDANGSGLVKRADFFKGLTECGYSQIPQAILLEMMQLFETKIEGLVNYSNFVEYVRGNQLCSHFEKISESLFKLVTLNNTPDDVAVREWFGKIDRSGQGKFSIQNFTDFLISQGLECPKEVMVALYGEFDADNLGVQYSQFSRWLVRYAAASRGHDDSRFANLTLGEIQKKAFHYLIAVAASQTANLESISESYALYDWRKSTTGAMAKSTFVRATMRAGFPFTKHDLMLVANEFSGNDGAHQVSYKQFLSWATPDKNSVANMSTSQGNALTFSKNQSIVSARSVSSMIQFLEHSFQRGIDLLSVFAKYDSSGEGRITASDFCAAFSDLGLSTVTETEAMEVASHFRAVAYDFVLYRYIVSEVLRKADETTGARDPDVLEVIKAMLLKSRVSLKQLRDKFEFYDRKLNGSIRCEDVYIVFDELHMRLRRPDYDGLIDRFGNSHSPDWLPYDPFIKALESRLNDKPLMLKGGKRGAELPEDLSLKCKNVIEKQILSGVDYRSAFDRHDDEISGSVSQNDFRRVMESFDKSFSNVDLHTLERVYKVRGSSAKVDFIRFLHHLHPRNFGRVTFNADGLLEKESWEIAEVLRQKIRKHSHDDYTVSEELHRNFRHFARRRGEAAVGIEDFAKAVNDLGLTISPDQEREVFNMINLNGGKQFKYPEFAVFVCDPQHLDIVWKLRRAIQRANIPESEIASALNEEDTSSLGLLSGKQFRKAMKSCNIDLSDTDILRLMRRFDTEENQRVDIGKFRKFLRGKDLDDANTDDAPHAKTESHTWNRLKDCIESKLYSGLSPNEVYSLFDEAGLDKLDVVSLHQGCRELGLVISRDEVKSVLRRMCQLVGGEVTRKKFFEALDIDMTDFRNRSRNQESRFRNNRVSGGYDDNYSRNNDGDDKVRIAFRKRPDLLEEIVARINQTLNVDRGTALGQLWDHMRKADHSRSGMIGKSDFSRALSSFGVIMKSGFERDLIDSIANDNQRGQEIDYLSFQSIIENEIKPTRSRSRDPPISDRLRNDTDSIIRTIRRKLEDYLGPGAGSSRRIREVFNEIDRDHNNKLDKREFTRAMSMLRIELDGRDVDLIYERFDYDRSGKLEYKEFLDLIDFTVKPQSARGEGERRGGHISDKLKNDTDDIIKLVRRKLEDHLGPGASSSHRIREAFNEIDRDHNMKIDKREFGKAMAILKVDLHPKDVDLLYERFDYNRSGYIEYKEFLDLIDYNAKPNTSRVSDKLKNDTDDIIKLVRRKLEDHLGPGASSNRRVKEAFEEIDRDGNKKIDKREFGRAMGILKVDLHPKDVDLLYERFDYNRSGYIEYKEFLDLIDFEARPGTARGSDKLRNDTDDIIKMVRRKLEDHLGPGASSSHRIREAFNEIDRDHNMKIDKREFGRAMSVLRVELDAKDVDRLYERFDRDRSGYIEYKEFLELIDFNVKPNSSRVSDKLKHDTDDIIKMVRRKLEDHLGPGASSNRKVKEAFDEIDRDGNKKIDKREFGKAMSILKVDLHPNDVDLLYERFDYNRSGYIEYKEFLDLIDFDAKPSTARGVPERVRQESDDIIKTVQRKLEDYLGPGASFSRKIREVFDEIDRDHNMKLDRREFIKAMSMLKVEMRDRDVDTLYERFDRDRSGFIEYKEFLELIDFNAKPNTARGGVSERVREESNDIIKTVRRKLEDYLGPGASSSRRIKEVFDEIDRDRNMKLDRREFTKAMSMLKVELRDRDVDTLYERFDRDRSGFIEYKEFLELIDFNAKPSTARGVSERVREESNDIIKTVKRKLEDYLGPGAGSSRRIKEVFSEIDRDGNMKLDRREFIKAMSMLKVDMKDRDVDTLYERFDRDRSGFIEYKEFLELIDFNAKPSTARSGVSDRVREESDDIIKTVKRKLEDYLGPGAGSSRRIKEVFNEIDRDGNMKLDRREFIKAMSMLKVEMRDRDVDTLYERFDRDRSGFIEYKEFLELIDFNAKPNTARGGVSERVREESNDIIKTVRRKLEDYLGPGASSSRRIREVFDEIDRDRNMKLDRREFTKAMSMLKVEMRDRDVDTLYERFDRDRSGFIEYKEFLELIDFNKPSSSTSSYSTSGPSSSRVSQKLRDDTDSIIRTVRRKLESYLGPGSNSARKIREVFDEIDLDGNRSIDKREFIKAMKILKVDIESKDVDLLYDRFDTNRSGSIDYKEFLELLDFDKGGRDHSESKR